MADSVKWTYDDKIKRYRNVSSGRLLSASAVTRIRDEIVAQAATDARALAEKVASGDLSAARFGDEMRRLIKVVHTANYSLGRGGVNALTRSDFGALGSAIRKEFKALDGFIRDIEQGVVKGDAIAMRADLYTDAGVASYERGAAAARGVELPPEHPPVHPRCACSFRWKVEDGQDVAYWVLGDRPCEICAGLFEKYQPWRGSIAA